MSEWRVMDVASEIDQPLKRCRFVVRQLGLKPVRTIGTVKFYAAGDRDRFIEEVTRIDVKKKQPTNGRSGKRA